MTNVLTPKEVAEILKVSYDSALAFIKYSGIEYKLIGNQYRVLEDVLDAFLHQKSKVIVNLSEPI